MADDSQCWPDDPSSRSVPKTRNSGY